VVMRKGHPFAARPTLQRFCEARHLVVSMTADPRGFLDDDLAKVGASRRIVLTVPDFGSGLAAVAETDVIAAMPRRYVAMHAPRFGLVAREVPLRHGGQGGVDGCRPCLAVRRIARFNPGVARHEICRCR